MKINNYSKKIHMVILFIMIFVLSVFKIIYIRREYLYLSTDYSIYILIFMPFIIFYALKQVDDMSSAVSLNWICTVPMSLYLYQSEYLYFKQYDMLLVYSVLGIFLNLIVFKKTPVRKIMPAVSGYITLNVLTLVGMIKELIVGLNGNNYEQYCVLNILKNSNLFSASENSKQYLDSLFFLPGKGSKLYFIAEKTAQYGIVNVIIVFILLIGFFVLLFIENYKRNNEISLIATAIMIMQSMAFLLVNLGILRGSVYELPLLKENIVYSLCQLLLFGIALDIKGWIFHIRNKILCGYHMSRNGWDV